MNSLVILEKYSRYWPVIAVMSTFVALMLYLSYLYSDSSILIEGYLSLGAFCFFALSVFSFFKLKDGRVKIEIHREPPHSIVIDYSLRGKQLAEEQIELEAIAEVRIGDMPDKSIYNNFATGDRSVMFRRHNGGDWFYMFQVHGRVIPLDKEIAQKVESFLLDQLETVVSQ